MKSFRLVTYHDDTKPSEILLLEGSDRPLGWSSISAGYDTEKECREKNGIPDKPCKLCGMIFSTRYIEPVKTKLLEENICHSCNHWKEISEWKKPGFRIDGGHWKACAEASGDSRFKGCGGRTFKIRMLDTGEIVTTSNLWHQGTIPAHFKRLLPDNAEFVKEEMPEAVGHGQGFLGYP